jgi:hypothetical protein
VYSAPEDTNDAAVIESAVVIAAAKTPAVVLSIAIVDIYANLGSI